MLETNGIPPKLNGQECEELICQQYWQQGKLDREVDVLFIKSHGRWFQLYFENSTIFWRNQAQAPIPYNEKDDDPFRYPLVDLGRKYGVKNKLLVEYLMEPMVGGARVVFLFETGVKIIVTCIDNRSRIQISDER